MGAMARSSVVRDARDDDRGCGWRRGDGGKTRPSRLRLASRSRRARARVTVVGRVGRSVDRSVDTKKTPIIFHTPCAGVCLSICHVVERHRNWDYRVIHYVSHSQRGY